MEETALTEPEDAGAEYQQDDQQEQEQPAAQDEDQPTEDKAASDTADDGAETKQGDDEQEMVPKARFNEVYRNWKEQERRAARLEERFKQVDGQGPAPDKPAEGTGKPKLEDFEDYEQYTEALVDWRYEQAQQKTQRQKALSQRREAEMAFDDRISSAFAKDPEFADKAYIPQALVDHFLDSEDPVSLAYHFGKDQAEAQRIARMNPVQAARAIGKIEASIAARAAGPPLRTTTRAPAPTSPAGGKSTITKDPAKMTHEEYRAWRSAGGGR